MHLTAFTDVTIRLLLLLSGLPEGTRLTTRQLAEGVGTPYHHVTKSVARLSSLGLVESVRGRSGGVGITPQGCRETVGNLLRELEGEQPVVDCEGQGGPCPLNHECGLRAVLARAQEAFFAVVDQVTVADLAHDRQVGPVMVQLGLAPPQDAESRCC